MANTPTILVKKSDGTFARMSLDEVKKIKEKKSEAVKPAPAITPTAMPISKPVSTQTPVFKPVPAQVTISKPLPPPAAPMKIDAKSLLEEDEPSAHGTAAVAGRLSQVDAIVKKLSFSVPAAFMNRLRSAVQLRLKEVRGEKETRATVLRSIKDGGLGPTEAQADELERAFKTAGNFPAPFAGKSPAALMVENEILPANTTPHNAFVHGIKTEIPKQAPVMPNSLRYPVNSKEIPKQVQDDRKNEQPFKISPVPSARPAMKDVVAKTAPVGPVEEIKFFTLTDFRRLAADPTQAAKRLAQKFVNLREESVLLFWQAQDAWKQSPLFGNYVSVLNGAFTGRTASADEKTADKITGSEIAALIQMEKDLGI